MIPDDPADAFLALLLEDMADEWGTKAMFHYRWAPVEDQMPNAFTLAQQAELGGPRELVERRASFLCERQVSRMPLVGCTPENAPLIEATARQVLALIDAHVPEGLWLFGARPSLADFGWYGQFSQLARDPTPRRMVRADYPAAFTWIETLDDASGLEIGPWRDPHSTPSRRPRRPLRAGQRGLPAVPRRERQGPRRGPLGVQPHPARPSLRAGPVRVSGQVPDHPEARVRRPGSRTARPGRDAALAAGPGCRHPRRHDLRLARALRLSMFRALANGLPARRAAGA